MQPILKFRFHRFWIIFTFAVCLATLPSASAAQDSFEHQEQIDALFQAKLDAKKFNSAVVGVYSKGKTWVKGYGQLTAEDKTVPDGNTLYEIGSISKVFTGIMLADAVEQGKLKLDQKIGTLIPEMDDFNEEVGNSISLQHLSHHMSGLPRMPPNMKATDPKNPFADYDREMLFDLMTEVTPFAEPNQKHQYSNLAVGLLGTLIAKNTGKSYEDVLIERVLKPLGMNDTSLTVEGERKKRFAPGHNAALKPDNQWDFSALAGAGGIRSSVNDMLKFAESNLNTPDGEIGAALELAWKQHLDADPGHGSMGLGWFIIPDIGGTHFHNGQTGGFHAAMFVNRKLQTASVVLYNTAYMGGDGLAEKAFQISIGMNIEPHVKGETIEVEESVVNRLIGKYQLQPGVIIDVTAKGTDVKVQLTGQGKLKIVPESETTWNLVDVEATVVFDFPEDDGSATKITLLQNGRKLPAPRIEK